MSSRSPFSRIRILRPSCTGETTVALTDRVFEDHWQLMVYIESETNTAWETDQQGGTTKKQNDGWVQEVD